MGIMQCPTQDMYWMKDRMFHPSCLETKFSRNRFESLQRYFHVTDTRRNPSNDKLVHIRPLLDKVVANCRREYNPHMEVSIDEAMVAFSGRLSFKQYVPLKPTKRGIKIWMRADPSNGYVNDFQVYTGKVANAPEKDLGARVVMDLMEPLSGLGHHLFCDSFFSSPSLFHKLLEKDTHACGTVKANRKGLPKELQSLKLKNQGDSVELQKGDLRVTAWRDKKQLCILSTNARQREDDSLASTERRVCEGSELPWCGQAL